MTVISVLKQTYGDTAGECPVSPRDHVRGTIAPQSRRRDEIEKD